MRYFGGGIGHTLQFPRTCEDYEDNDAMDIDEGENADTEAPPIDAYHLEELQHAANTIGTGVAGERDVVEDPVDLEDVPIIEDPLGVEVDSDDEASEAGDEGEYDLGPEDGEDEDYFDTGYGAL